VDIPCAGMNRSEIAGGPNPERKGQRPPKRCVTSFSALATSNLTMTFSIVLPRPRAIIFMLE
jgi:hypothetical protein